MYFWLLYDDPGKDTLFCHAEDPNKLKLKLLLAPQHMFSSNTDSLSLRLVTRWHTYSSVFAFHSGRKCQRTMGVGISQERKAICRQHIDLQIAVTCVTPITNSHPRRAGTSGCVCTRPALQDKLSILLGTNKTESLFPQVRSKRKTDFQPSA